LIPRAAGHVVALIPCNHAAGVSSGSSRVGSTSSTEVRPCPEVRLPDRGTRCYHPTGHGCLPMKSSTLTTASDVRACLEGDWDAIEGPVPVTTVAPMVVIRPAELCKATAPMPLRRQVPESCLGVVAVRAQWPIFILIFCWPYPPPPVFMRTLWPYPAPPVFMRIPGRPYPLRTGGPPKE
jgi:hypothetical protein